MQPIRAMHYPPSSNLQTSGFALELLLNGWCKIYPWSGAASGEDSPAFVTWRTLALVQVGHPGKEFSLAREEGRVSPPFACRPRPAFAPTDVFPVSLAPTAKALSIHSGNVEPLPALAVSLAPDSISHGPAFLRSSRPKAQSTPMMRILLSRSPQYWHLLSELTNWASRDS